MQLIQGLRIEGFRSIQDESLEELDHLTALVGKNSTGKSNVLRALNLFFNGEVEPGKPVDFRRDHYEQTPPLKKKKRIRITVAFQIPDKFKFRSELTKVASLGPRFEISRVWELDERHNPISRFEVLVDGEIVDGSEDLSRQFLGLVSYRYVPNRTVPARLLQTESQNLANSIVIRMKGDKNAGPLLEALDAASERLLQNASSSMHGSGAPLSNPSLATPSSLGELLNLTGFQASGQHGVEVQDEEWGSGHQAFFLFQLLQTLDTDYSRFFGWRQATVWGVEEPESALHRDLETALAEEFRGWARDESRRIQILETTHSAVFTMASDGGYFVDLAEGKSRFRRMDVRRLTRAAETRGVSGWVHPVLTFPWNPVVLVEGSIDANVLEHVSSLLGSSSMRFVWLRELDPDEQGGGKDAIIKYLGRSREVIKNRPADAPLLVLLDWETPDQELEKARTAYGDHGPSRVFRMKVEHCEAAMGPDFAGIERFYPTSVVRDAAAAGEVAVAEDSHGVLTVSQSQLRQAKGRLMQRVLGISDLDELGALTGVSQELEDAVERAKREQLPLPAISD